MCNIVPLPKAAYEGHEIVFEYDSELYYDVRLYDTPEGTSADFVRMPFPQAKRISFVCKLYEPFLDAPEAFGVFEEERLTAVVEISPEIWCNRLRITNLWVDEGLRRGGIGQKLIEHVKEIAQRRKARAIVLETQTCNAGAVAFYRSQGFTLTGFDALAYSNEDIERKEVRVEMALRIGRRGQEE